MHRIRVVAVLMIITSLGIMFFPVSSRAGVAYVQGKAADEFGNSSVSASFQSNVTQGDVIAVGVLWFSTSVSLNSVTANCVSGNFTLLGTPTVNGTTSSGQQGYAVIGSSGACTVTANFSGSVNAGIVVHEISGVSTSNPLDGSSMNYQNAPGTGTDAVTSGNITTTQNGDYIFGLGLDAGANSTTFSAGTGFTNRVTLTEFVQTEDRIQTSAGSIAATFTINLGYVQTITGVMAFRPASSGSGSGYVQGKAADEFGNSSVSASFQSNVTQGDVIAVGVLWFSTSVSLNSVTANCVNGNFTLVGSPTVDPSTSSGQQGYAAIASSGACTVTANFSGSVNAGIVVHEISGVSTSNPLDGSSMNYQNAPGTGTDAVTSGSITTTQNGDYIFGLGLDSGANSATFTAGTGFTNRVTLTEFVQTEDRIQTSAGSIAATFTVNLGYAKPITGVMAFKPSGSGGGCSSAPPAPTGLSASAGNAQVSLSWNASSCATSYNIYRSQTSGTEASPAIASPSGTSYTDTGVTNNQNYYYVVTAVNSFGESAHSNEAGPVMPTAGLLSITSCGTVGQGGNDQPVFQSCLEQATNSGKTLDIPAGTYNLSPCTTSCGSGQANNSPWAIHFPANGNMKLESGVTINASGSYTCSSSPMAMFEMEENGITLSGAGASNSVISMQSQGFCEPHEILRIAGKDKAMGNIASNITISGITAKYGSGDDLYITYADSVSVTNSTFDHGQRNSASLTDMVTNITFNNDTFQYAYGDPCAGSHCPNAGLDIEPNVVSSNKVQGILIQNSTFTHNGSQTTSPTNYTNYGDGIQIQLDNLAGTGNSGGPVSITITGATSSFNNRYGFVALNADGGNPSGTVEIDQSSSTNDGFQCAVGRFWASGGESFVINGLTCTNPHHNRTSPDGTYGTYGSGSAVGSFRGGGSYSTALGAVHFENTNISITDSNTLYYFEFEDFSNGNSNTFGFGTDTDFYPLGTMSGATPPPQLNGKNGYFQPLNSGAESQTCNSVQAGACK